MQPLEFESEDELQKAVPQPELEMQEEPPSDLLTFESEADFQAAISDQPAVPQEASMDAAPMMPGPQGPSLNPSDLASAVLGNAVPQPELTQVLDRKTIVESYGPQGNTLAQQLPEGIEPIHPADMESVTDVLSKSFMAMSSTGILLDPMERVMYATSVMENTAMRADIRAQLIDQAMRDGKILPEALPKSWFEARGLLLLPPNLNLDDLEGELA